MKEVVHAIVGFIVSISSAMYGWFVAHGNTVAVAISIIAGLYTIRAARSAHALHKAQKQSLDYEKKSRHFIHPRSRV